MEKSPDVFLRKICSLDQSTKIMISNNKLNTFLEKTNNSHRAPQKGNFRPKIKFLKHQNLKYIIKNILSILIYGKKEITAIIQARIGSSRYRGKILKKIKSKEIILLQILRLKKCKNIKQIIVAIPNNKDNII